MACPKDEEGGSEVFGLAGYYRMFICDFATIVTPLSDQTRKSAPMMVQWLSRAQKSFDSLGDRITSFPVLRCPDRKNGRGQTGM